MVESYTSFSTCIHARLRGNFAICPPGKSYAKFKSVQTIPYHYYNFIAGFGFMLILESMKKQETCQSSVLGTKLTEEYKNAVFLMFFREGKRTKSIHYRKGRQDINV